MKKELIKLANHLDSIGLVKEADYVDALLKRYAASSWQLPKPGDSGALEKWISEGLVEDYQSKPFSIQVSCASQKCLQQQENITGKTFNFPTESLENIAKALLEMHDPSVGYSPLNFSYEEYQVEYYKGWKSVYKKILELNNIKNPEAIAVGTKITIPFTRVYFTYEWKEARARAEGTKTWAEKNEEYQEKNCKMIDGVRKCPESEWDEEKKKVVITYK